MGYLRPESIHILKTNPGKYTVQNDSWAQEKLEVFWEYVTNFIPPWISANAITIASIFPLFPFVLYAFIQPPPMPILYQALASLAIFFFQTMDGVDGIHARRCKTCSPLGDLLDHIIDQVCALCCVIVCASSLGFVLDGFILVFLTNCAMMSFMVHWQTTHTKLLVFQNGSSIIEAQLGMIALNLVAPILGQQIWDICPFALIPYSPEFLTTFKLNQITAVVIMVIPTPAVITAAISVYKLKGFSVFREVVPMILMIAMNVHWFIAERNGATSMTVAHGITCINTWYCVCFTLLHRITQQPLKWYSTLHILVPGAFLPYVPDQYKFNAYYIFLAYASVVFSFFLLSILRTFSNALGVPLLAQSKDAYQRLKSKK